MYFEEKNHTTDDINNLSCNAYIHHNRTFTLGTEFGYIPETLLINFCTWVVLLFLFALLRKNAWNYGRIALVQKNEQRWTQLFYGEKESPIGTGLLYHQDSVDSVDIIVHVDQGFCSWLVAIFKIKDEHILKKCGQDAIQYLTFQRYIIVFVSILCFVCLTIILPVNFQGDLGGSKRLFGHTTISNLHPTSSLFWVHVTFAFLFFPLGIYLMRHFSVNLKLEEQDATVSRTLMITHIPKNHCLQDTLLQHFQEAYPECIVQDIQFAYNISVLMNLDQKRKATCEAKVWCETFLKEHNTRLQMQPCRCSCFCCNCCKLKNCEQVDAIDFYTTEEMKLSFAIEKEKHASLRNALGIAFVTFQTREMAYKVYGDHQTSCKCGNSSPHSSISRDLEPLAWEVYYAPSPEDIYWENLSSNTDNWYIRAVVINTILFVLLFFLTTPAIFANSLVVNWLQNKLESMNPLLSEFAPTILMWLVAALLPVIVSYSDQFLYHWTRSGENHSIMRKTFIFLLFMVIILPSLGLMSAKAFVEWAVNQANETDYRWKCIFLPDNGAFFVNYVITSAFIGTALEFIRFPELFMYVLRLLCARSPAERARVHKGVLWQFPFGTQYAWMLLNVGVTIIYSLPCPIIAVFGLVYICFKHCVDRYNIYFAYGPSKINKQIHVTAINFVIVTIILLQMVILFFLFIRTGGAWNVKSAGKIVWVSLIGCGLSIILFIGQLFFKLFQRFSPVHHQGQADVVICDDDSPLYQCTGTDLQSVVEHVSTPKFVASVLQPEGDGVENVFSVQPGQGQQRCYGTRNGDATLAEDPSIADAQSFINFEGD